jgi:formate-dependent nitrite reductase membrane component NrfD
VLAASIIREMSPDERLKKLMVRITVVVVVVVMAMLSVSFYVSDLGNDKHTQTAINFF